MSALAPIPRLPPTPGERRVAASVTLALLGLFALDLLRDPSPRMLGALFLVLAWGPLLVVHELGHALAAWLVGWRVSEIVIGFGREIARFTVGPTRVLIKLAPVEGYVLPSPRDLKLPRLKSAFIFAAGPGVEVLVFIALWLVAGERLFTRSDDTLMLLLQGTAAAIGLGLFFNLMPLPIGGGVTDGLGMILSLFLPREHFRARLLTPLLRDAKLALLVEETDRAAAIVEDGVARHGTDPRLVGLSAVIQAQRGDPEGARAALSGLEDEEGAAIFRAWTLLHDGAPDTLPFARQSAERAVQADPIDPVARALLGRALLGLGLPRDAFIRFMEGYQLARTAEEEGYCLGYLAIASKRAIDAGGDSAGAAPRIGGDFPKRFRRALGQTLTGPRLRAEVERALGTEP